VTHAQTWASDSALYRFGRLSNISSQRPYNVQIQGAASPLTKHKRFQRSFELFEGDVRLPKLFRQTLYSHTECCRHLKT